jgi:wyosine [tRNA(Phe)-imidazoG37] synthetase (radical SAM superfamily)
LTNGSLLWEERVRRALMDADIVAPSIDAVSSHVFKRINRPVAELTISKVLKGLKKFSDSFKGKIYLEIMIVKGINDTDAEISKIRDFVQDLRIDKIQLNTVVRPPSEEYAFSLNNEEMEYIREKLFCTVPVEIIGSFSPKSKVFFDGDIENEIINLLKRRPCTLQDMSDVLGIHHNELIKYITELMKKNIIRSYLFDDSRGNYYMCY